MDTSKKKKKEKKISEMKEKEREEGQKDEITYLQVHNADGRLISRCPYGNVVGSINKQLQVY